MPDEPASTAPSAAAVADPEIPPMDSWTEAELKNWRMNGTIPEPKPAKAAEPAAAAKPAANESSATAPPPSEELVETAPASEAGKVQEPPKKPEGEKRKSQLHGEIQGLLKQRSELRQELEGLLAQKAGFSEPSAKPPGTPPAEPPTELKRPRAPRYEDANSSEEYEAKQQEYETALDKYFSELADSKAQAAVAEDRKQREIVAQRQAEQRQFQTAAMSWDQKVSEFQKTYPEAKDYQEITEALLEGDVIPEGSFLDGWILRSPIGPALLYHFAQHSEEVGKILAMDFHDASLELHTLALSLSSNGTKKKEVSAPPKTTAASRPPRELSGHATPPGDEVEAAIDAGDVAGYIQKANARDAATRKGY